MDTAVHPSVCNNILCYRFTFKGNGAINGIFVNPGSLGFAIPLDAGGAGNIGGTYLHLAKIGNCAGALAAVSEILSTDTVLDRDGPP